MWAQNASPDPGSIGALVAEVRQLRLAVEESTRSQSQTQALGVYLSAEQSRLIQLSSRLDAVRTQLAGVTARSLQAANYLADGRAAVLLHMSHAVTDGLGMVEMFKQQADAVADEEQQIRNRESELVQSFQTEEARWIDLVTKLEQLVRK